MTAKRFIPALVIAVLLASAATVRAQIPVTDIFALVEHVIEVALQTTIREVRQIQAERLYKMSLRLAEWVSLDRYWIDADDMPEWRIHDWFTGFNQFSNDFLAALTYGDASGAGYGRAVLPRQDPETVLGGLSPTAAAFIRSDLALLDVADSAIIRATHETGRLRYNGRAEAEAIIALQAAVTEDDNEQSLTSALDKLAATALVEAQNRQAKGQFDAAVLEQLLVEQLWDRNADTAGMNLILSQFRAAQDDEGQAASLVEHAGEALRLWQLP